MTRITSILALASAILLFTSSSSVQAQYTPAAVSEVAAATTCVIATPGAPLEQGKPYKVLFSGCSGTGAIELRYGNQFDLQADRIPACPIMDLSTGSGSCMFIPTRSGTGFSFSTIDASNIETFSGDFSVLGSPEAKMIMVHTQNRDTPSVQPQVQAKKMMGGGRDGSKPAIMNMRRGPQAARGEVMMRKRALYDMTGFAIL